MTAVLGNSDLGRLCALARRWQDNPLGLGRARDLAALLDQIIGRRAAGGDELSAFVYGDSIPELHAAALAEAAKLWGPRAELAVEATGTVHTSTGSGSRYHTSVRVRCLNYAEIAR